MKQPLRSLQLLALGWWHPSLALSPVAIKTSIGDVHGGCASSTCRFLNVSYAEQLARFEQSRPKISEYGRGGTGGTGFGTACVQPAQDVGALTAGVIQIDDGQSEDCLKLNIWVPRRALEDASSASAANANSPSLPASAANASSPSLPVMVWIHGGGFVIGSACDKLPRDQYLYNGTSLSQRGVIVVTIQYRLGLFGFLQREDATGGANGLGDQVAALKWVRAHIQHFNGNPDMVTIFGSVSVCALAHMPSAHGLFQRMIAESGVCYPSGNVMYSRSQGAKVRRRLLRRSNLTAEEIQHMDAPSLVERALNAFGGDLTKLFQAGYGQPSVDGDLLPQLPVDAEPLTGIDAMVGITSWDNPEVEILSGGRSSFVKKFAAAREYGRVTSSRRTAFVASQVLAYYDRRDLPDKALVMDACVKCQSIAVARRVQEHGAGRAFFYVYDDPPQRSTHGEDLLAVFGIRDPSLPPLLAFVWPAPPPGLPSLVQSVWATFARTGDPNVGEGMPTWPKVSSEDSTPTSAMVFSADGARLATVEAPVCWQWTRAADGLGYARTSEICKRASQNQDDLAFMGDLIFGWTWVTTPRIIALLVLVLASCCTFLCSCVRRCWKGAIADDGTNYRAMQS